MMKRSGRQLLISAAKRAGYAARDTAHSRFYAARRRRPIDPDLAVYGAYWYRGCQCNPRAIYEAASVLAPQVRGVWVVADAANPVPDGVERVVANTYAYYDLIARAGVFVNNVNFPNHLVKRPGTIHVMTHHGTPLKLMGRDLEGRTVGDGRIDFAAQERRNARWDFIITPNAHSTAVFQRAYPGDYETLEVGYPRNDVLAQAGADDVARCRAALGLRPNQRALLFAPTHRDTDTTYVAPLDVKALADRLGPGWVVLSRPHHRYVAPGAPASPESATIVDVSRHPSIEALCLAADVLVTDYSSVMFDYAVLDRPIVSHIPDWEAYEESRGTYFDLLELSPGLITRTEEELVEALLSGAYDEEPARVRRQKFRATFCSRERGTAASEVVRRIWPQHVRSHAPATIAGRYT